MTDSTPAGWYPAPNEPGNERFFDGAQWTEERRPAAQPAPPAPTGKQKKPLWKRKWVWALGAIIAIVAIASASGTPDDEADPVAATADDAVPGEDATTEQNNSEEDSDDEQADAPATGTLQIRDIGDMGNDHVGRVNAITADVSALNEFVTVPAGMTITRADIEVCAGSRELNVNPLYWNAQDTENRSLDVLLGGQQWPTITLAAGGCVSGTIDFQVPEGASVGSVFITGAAFQEQARWQNEGENLTDVEPLVPFAPPAAVAAGTTVDLTAGATATLYSVETDTAPASDFVTIAPGATVMRIDVEVCAGDSSLNVNPLYWVGVGDRHATADALLGAQQYDTLELAAGQCQRGTIDFEIPAGEAPAYALLTNTGFDEVARWSAK